MRENKNSKQRNMLIECIFIRFLTLVAKYKKHATKYRGTKYPIPITHKTFLKEKKWKKKY